MSGYGCDYYFRCAIYHNAARDENVKDKMLQAKVVHLTS